MKHPTIINVFLDGRILTEKRDMLEMTLERHRQNPKYLREKLREQLDEISADWKPLKESLSKWGPSTTYGGDSVRSLVTKLTCAGELHDHVHRIVRNVEFDNVGANFNYKERFEEVSAEYYALLEAVITLLDTPAKKLPIPDNFADRKDDTKGNALFGKIQNLLYGRHLVNVLVQSSKHGDNYEHARYEDFLKLTGTVDRHLADALIRRANVYEGARNDRIAKRKAAAEGEAGKANTRAA